MSTLEEAEEANGRVTKTFPLNSRRLTAEVLARIARALGLPTNASSAETRQLIEGKLAEDHEPQNVQVDVTELATGVVEISLRDQDGLFAEIPADEGAGEEPGRDGGEEVLEKEAAGRRRRHVRRSWRDCSTLRVGGRASWSWSWSGCRRPDV